MKVRETTWIPCGPNAGGGRHSKQMADGDFGSVALDNPDEAEMGRRRTAQQKA